jgi:prolipoprotein diacylglyceryltransferase
VSSISIVFFSALADSCLLLEAQLCHVLGCRAIYCTGPNVGWRQRLLVCERTWKGGLSAPGPLILTRFVSKVGFELFPRVIAKLVKAVEALQPDVELGRS